ncbi:MAG: ATP-dependent helicase [Caldilineaceae bacterium]
MIKYEEWKPSGGLKLEPNARAAAISRNGCIALIAGPGAGKTEMLAQRADFLLRTGACRYPKRILAISFKRDASENLKQRVEARCGKELASRFDSYTFHAFSKRIMDIFRPCLSKGSALDENYTIEKYSKPRTQITFNDLVPLANKIIGNCPVARNSIQQTYSDVFLDEFQDCTKIQYSLVQSAFLGSNIRLVAVGDTKQKIMGWAGALDGVFLKFENDFNALSLNLYQNFRALPRIRRVQNAMIKDIDPLAAVDDEQLTGDGGTVIIRGFSTELEEANWIADSIQSLFDNGVALSEIAILCNTQPHLYAYHLMKELERRNIPFRNEQEIQDLFCEPIYRIIVDYLIVLLGSSEPDAWERLTSAIFPDDHQDTNGEKTRAWVQFIRNQQSRVRNTADFVVVWQTIDELIHRIGNGVVAALSHDYENSKRFAELVNQTKDQVQRCFDGNLGVVELLKSLSEINSVRILTIHKCKGLEFDTVIIQGVEHESFFGKKEDSECAYFVAISRAKKQLIVTTSNFRNKLPGANKYWACFRSPHQQFLSYMEPHVSGAE